MTKWIKPDKDCQIIPLSQFIISNFQLFVVAGVFGAFTIYFKSLIQSSNDLDLAVGASLSIYLILSIIIIFKLIILNIEYMNIFYINIDMIIQYVFLMIYGVFSYSIFKLIVVNQFIMNILLGVFTLIIIFYTLVKIPQLLKIPYKLFLSTVSIIGILVPIFLFIVNYMNIIPIDSDNSMIIGGIGYSIFVLSSLLMFKSGTPYDYPKAERKI